MLLAFTTIATIVMLLLAVGLLVRCWLVWKSSSQPRVSDVAKQHFEIFQTGEFNEAAVEVAKRRFHVLFERGGEPAVEASIRPGPHFIYQVRALAEIGTDAAGRILERQLKRRLSTDQLEQSWYWIDVAACLRHLNRQESLPTLLQCSERAREGPLGHYFAAETICILGFAGFLRRPETPMGETALRLVHRAIAGMREGLHPNLIVESRLGELLETIWDHRRERPSALLARMVIEALRLLQRAPNWKPLLSDEMAEMESFDWQLSRIAALEPGFREFLGSVEETLIQSAAAPSSEQLDALRALSDLRIDTGDKLLSVAGNLQGDGLALLVTALQWSRDPQAGAWLRYFAHAHVPAEKRSRSKPLADAPPEPSIDPAIPYAAVLRALRGHASCETEKLLILASQDWDPLMRSAAVSSLGWWEPMLQMEVRECLTRCRRDPNAEVRQSARAALARLGERTSLHWFRQALLADDPHQVAQAAHVIANEGLTLLWPDLDRLLDADHADVVMHAHEAVGRLHEEMAHSRM